jgi:hypothetical protein
LGTTDFQCIFCLLAVAVIIFLGTGTAWSPF